MTMRPVDEFLRLHTQHDHAVCLVRLADVLLVQADADGTALIHIRGIADRLNVLETPEAIDALLADMSEPEGE